MSRPYSSLSRVLAVTFLIVSAGCGGDNAGQPPSNGGSGQTITGSERLGWDIQVADAAELALVRYAIYVDGARSELTGANCSAPAASSAAACSARFPQMSAGQHTIELASFVVAGGTVVESPKSAPLVVTVAAGTLAGMRSPPGSSPGPGSAPGARLSLAVPRSTITTADGVRLTLRVIANGLDEPRDIALAPDGRVFVAERAGRLRVVENPPAAISGEMALDEIDTSDPSGGLIGLALSPSFESDRFMYALYTVAGREGPVVRIARFREAGGTFGERAVVADNLPAPPGRAGGAIRFGPDGRLYVALGEPLAPPTSAGRNAFGGKVLRLNPDGTTPRDDPDGDPVYSRGSDVARGLDWHPVTGELWVIDASGGVDRLVAVTNPKLRREQVDQPAGLLPADTGASGLAAYGSARVPALRGDLLVAAAGAGTLLRVKLDRGDPAQILWTERLLPDGIGPVRAVAVGADGVAYVAAGGALLTLSPARP